MSDFNIILTDGGAALLAALIAAEEPLETTRMAIGDGELAPEQDPAELTALISQQQIVTISGVTTGPPSSINIRGDFINAGLEEGFSVREIGIFAADPSEGPDILLAYGNAGADATFFPPAGTTALNLAISAILAVSSDLIVNLSSESGVYVNLGQWSVHLSGAGGTDQHPLATAAALGLMSAADKARLDGLLSRGQYILAQDVKAAGTHGGTFTSGAWRTRDLNTLAVDETGLASLSSNRLILPAGTYYVHIQAPGHKVENHKIALKNITDNSILLLGTTTKTDRGSDDTTSVSVIVGRFVISAGKEFEVQHICELTQSNSGFGLAYALGASDIYTILQLWRVS